MTDESYPIAGELRKKYKGPGLALGAVTNGELVDFVYLREVLEELDESDLVQALSDKRLTATARYLSAIGDVRLGSCVEYEFRVL